MTGNDHASSPGGTRSAAPPGPAGRRRERGPGDPVPRPSDEEAPHGLLARWDRRNQYRGEVDNLAYVASDGDRDAQVSPLLNRYWQVHVGWLAVAAVGALVWWSITAILA